VASVQRRQQRQTSEEQPLLWSRPFQQLSAGQRFRTAARTVSEADVIGFCALTGDWHPQHCDPRWAAAGPFGERIAHGMLILSFAVGLVPLDPERVIALRRVRDAVFKRPLRLGEQLAAEGEIGRVSAIDEAAALVDVGLAIVNQDGALVCRVSVQLLWSGERAAAPRGRFWHDPVLGEAPDGTFVPVPL
jgi:3-hydroxybutyryl-CoA dehydratase